LDSKTRGVINRLVYLVVRSLQLENHPSHALFNVRTPNVRNDLEALAHAVNDGLGYQMFRKGEVEPSFAHADSVGMFSDERRPCFSILAKI
jgi:hypothetical protein